MSLLFADTSALVAVAFGERDHRRVAAVFESADDIFASPLLEAEFRSVLVREQVSDGLDLLKVFRWVAPNRPLGPELAQVFSSGYVRGADAWHLATALFVSESPADMPFLTLDDRQRAVAEALGFPTPS